MTSLYKEFEALCVEIAVESHNYPAHLEDFLESLDTAITRSTRWDKWA